MSHFTENVHIAPLPKENKWSTTKRLVWYISDKMEGEKITIPSGFVFDGASVPMLLGSFIQRVEPKTINCACLHDWLYRKDRKRGRRFADRVFYEALISCGCSKFKAWVMWFGVRIFGWTAR